MGMVVQRSFEEAEVVTALRTVHKQKQIKSNRSPIYLPLTPIPSVVNKTQPTQLELLAYYFAPTSSSRMPFAARCSSETSIFA